MSIIKSAIELALARSDHIEVDKEVLQRKKQKQEGQILAGKYLANPKEISLEAELKKTKTAEKSELKKSIADVLISNILLPRDASHLESLPLLTSGLKEIGPKSSPEAEKFDRLIEQINTILLQYGESSQELEKELRQQWEPRLRQKEAQIKQETGKKIRLTSEQDPEFIKYFTENFASLKAQYTPLLSTVKDAIRKFL